MSEGEILFPNLKVLCDLHRPLSFKGWEECREPECQEVISRRKEEVRSAEGDWRTDEVKAVWRAWVPGVVGRHPVVTR